MGEKLLASTGLGGHCDRLGGSGLEMPQWKWRGGVAVRDLVDIESMGLGNLNVEVSEKGSNQGLHQV